MTLARDLLRQASQLATREPKRPKQSSLRRAISAAYYALFHLLVDHGTRRLVRGDRSALRGCLARAFKHQDMKVVCKSFASQSFSPKIKPALDGLTVPGELRDIAEVFVDLQQARHEADYDRLRRFNRTETLELIERVRKAFDDWQNVKEEPAIDVFLVALLCQKSMQS